MRCLFLRGKGFGKASTVFMMGLPSFWALGSNKKQVKLSSDDAVMSGLESSQLERITVVPWGLAPQIHSLRTPYPAKGLGVAKPLVLRPQCL